jgi:hypothetical protein
MMETIFKSLKNVGEGDTKEMMPQHQGDDASLLAVPW